MSLKSFFTVFIILNCLNSWSQPSHKDFQFIGRYVEWANDLQNPNDDGVFPLNNAYTAAPLDHVKGFWNEPFYITLYYDTNIEGKEDDDGNLWIDDLIKAVNDWNSASNLAQINLLPLGLEVQSTIFQVPPINTVFHAETAPLITFSPGDKALARTDNFVIYDINQEPCGSNSVWPHGNVLLGGHVFFSDDDTKKFFAGDRVAGAYEYSVYSIFLHELGHFLGLNHPASGRKRQVMYKSHASNKIKHLEPEDKAAINRLYGFDGIALGGDPLFSSLPCDIWNSSVTHLLATDANGWELIPGQVPDPCNDCGQGVNEDGIDCGPFCGPCEDKCTASMYQQLIQDDSELSMDFNVVKQHINIQPQSSVNVLAGEYYYFKAGDYIEITPAPEPFSIEKNSDVTMEIGSCECPPVCLRKGVLGNYFCPEGQKYGINVNGADSYIFKVREWNDQSWDLTKTGSINGNFVNLWDGNWANGNRVADNHYAVELTLKNSCNGSEKIYSLTGPDIFLYVHHCDDPERLASNSYIETSAAQSFNGVEIDYYPNPTNGVFSVSSNYLLTSIKIFNSASQPVLDIAPLGHSYSTDLSDILPPGAYFIEVIAGPSTKRGPIVVE